MSEASRSADRRAAENLLACHGREVAFPAGEGRWTSEGELSIVLPATRREIRVATRGPSLVRGFELLGDPRLDGEVVDAMALARALVAEIAARFDRPAHPELMGLIADSRAVVTHLLARRAQPPDGVGFLAAEQALTFGHPYHPSPKARAGFDAGDLDRYSPELGAGFPLHLFAARAELIAEESLDGPCRASVGEALGGGLSCRDGFALLPAHPWQARSALESGLLERYLQSGAVIDLGPAGPSWFPTASVRTLYRPGAPYFLKASLGVRITNCLRRNAAHELRCAVQVTRWVRAVRPTLSALFPSFTALDEVAWRALYPRDVEPAVREQLGELFGFVLREAGPVHATSPASAPRVAAALFGDRDEGRARLDMALPAARREAWLSGYLEALVSPLLWLFFEAGLMFEPHLQNVLVGGFGGTEVTAFLRDYDNAKVVAGLGDPGRLAGLLPEVVKELHYPADVSWERFVYCLFTNNLAEVAAMLAGGDTAAERRSWQMIRAHLEGWMARFGTERSRGPVAALLTREGLPAKANLLTRVFKHKDRDAPFVMVPNPLRR
ncbi:MAG: IucA/IucC family protein [Minicystis sp.]